MMIRWCILVFLSPKGRSTRPARGSGRPFSEVGPLLNLAHGSKQVDPKRKMVKRITNLSILAGLYFGYASVGDGCWLQSFRFRNKGTWKLQLGCSVDQNKGNLQLYFGYASVGDGCWLQSFRLPLLPFLLINLLLPLLPLHSFRLQLYLLFY